MSRAPGRPPAASGLDRVEKACPLVARSSPSGQRVLAFEHPLAGVQVVKGTIEPGEAPQAAAERELWEESGISPPGRLLRPGACEIGPERQMWHFFSCRGDGLTERWKHDTEDGGGVAFSFFWHPVGGTWHALFHEALAFAAPRLAAAYPLKEH